MEKSRATIVSARPKISIDFLKKIKNSQKKMRVLYLEERGKGMKKMRIGMGLIGSTP